MGIIGGKLVMIGLPTENVSLFADDGEGVVTTSQGRALKCQPSTLKSAVLA